MRSDPGKWISVPALALRIGFAIRGLMNHETLDGKKGFEAEYTGQMAECDGGGPIHGTRYAGRQDFHGRLTGDCVDVGDPPSRWYLMVDLTLKPEGFAGDAVWCLAGNTFLGEHGPVLRNGPDVS